MSWKHSWDNEGLIKNMVGATLASVEQIGNDQLILKAEDGRKWKMYHRQNCCESVEIVDIAGTLDDLVGSPLLLASERTSDEEYDVRDQGYGYVPDSFTWTFYSFATAKGYVTIRWLGQSNGYYGEAAELAEWDPTGQGW